MPQLGQIQNIYLLLRHGETDFNAKKRFPGFLDVPLNENGRNQVKAVRLPATPNLIISSNLIRTVHTAKAVGASHNFPDEIQLDSRLREKHGGVVEGSLIQQIQTLYPDIWNAWDLEDKFAVAAKSQYPEGKSDVDVANR